MTSEFEKEFGCIVGYDEIKEELYQICDVIKHPDIYEPLGAEMPRGLLLYGEPGLGKTTLAECLMKTLGFPVFACRKETTGNDFLALLKQAFEDAKASAPAIVFLDDFDKFANEDFMHPNSEEYVAIQGGIESVKDSKVFVIATANDLNNLPDSLLRAGRFDRKVEVKKPSYAETRQIVKHYLMQKTALSEAAADDIAALLYEENCAEVKNHINEASILAGYDRSPVITKDHMIEACLRSMYKAPKSKVPYSPNALRRIAIHEAGHAVVRYILRPESLAVISVRKNSGSTNGFVSFIPDEDENHNFESLEIRTMCALGGKAATELLTGEMDIGCSRDLCNASHFVELMVSDFAAAGFEALDVANTNHESEEKMVLRERAVSAKLNDYYQRVKVILADNREFMQGIIDFLMQKDVMTASEVKAVYEQTLVKAA